MAQRDDRPRGPRREGALAMMFSTAARLGLASAVSLVIGAVALAGPVAAAKPTRCLVIDVTTDAAFRSLQPALDSAPAGATLRLKGTCVGTTEITRDITIVGDSNPGFGPATLDGQGQGPVVAISGEGRPVVTISGLWIRNGSATLGGGIQVRRGPSVALINSVVSGNAATSAGGGIWVNGGSFDIVDSIVRDNTASGGGGVYVFIGAEVTLRGRSAVTGNHASRDGGGIEVDHALLVLLDRSSVDHNIADQYGGGVACGDCEDAALFDDAEIHHNTAGLGGGGLNSGGLAATHMGDRSSIHDNSAPVGGGVRLIMKSLSLSGTSSIRHNTATDTGGGAYVYLSAGVRLADHSSIDHNVTTGDGGGVAFGSFGFVWVADDSSITANTASRGGGTYIEDRAQVVLSENGRIEDNVPDDCYPPSSVPGCAT
jgi:hypothetical protein